MPKTLYICYFGLREPLVQTQVLPYLREIMKDGVEVSLITFEPDFKNKWPIDRIEAHRLELASEGIDWHGVAYHKRLSAIATAYDIFYGAVYVRRLISGGGFDILHCRVHVPMLIGALARKFSRSKPKLLFDIRGFFPEEYTDAGIWPENGWLYRSTKRIEKWLLKQADGFVVLTERAREILFVSSKETGFDSTGRPVEVIPCCVDLKKFDRVDAAMRDAMRSELGVGNRFVIAYIGSFGGWYLSDEMFDFFAAARRRDPTVFIMVMTQRQPDLVVGRLRANGFKENDFFVGTVSPAQIPRYLNAADVGVSFIKPCYSKQASSPTKNAEYLASGLPIVANSGIGDVDTLLTENKIGVLVSEFSPEAFSNALRQLDDLGEIAITCREIAERDFDMEAVGGPRYRRIYSRLMDKGQRKTP